jgi:hypothetical protein
MKTTFLLLTAFLFSFKSFGQYREMIFYHVPVGDIKYFHKDDNVMFKLKSEERFETRKGKINLMLDSVFVISTIRFHPDNLEWISTSLSRSGKFFRSLAGTLLLAGGAAIVAYGISGFPSEELKKENAHRYHEQNITALSYAAAGIAVAAVSIPVYSIQPKKYKASRKWRITYQR